MSNFYDYGFRQLDPQLGRWHVIDALSESFASTSPYAYVLNNPINMYDVMGLLPNTTVYNWGGSLSLPGSNGGSLGNFLHTGSNRPEAGPTYEDTHTEYEGVWFDNDDIKQAEGKEARLGWAHHLMRNGVDLIKFGITGYKTSVDGVIIKLHLDGIGTWYSGEGDPPGGNNIGLNYGLYYGSGSMYLGAAGNYGGLKLDYLKWHRPIVYNNGRVLYSATAHYKFSLLHGNAALKLGKGLRIGGNLLGAAGIFYTLSQMNEDNILKSSVDIGFGVVGFLGPIGLGISSVYFLGDTFLPGGLARSRTKVKL